MSDAISQFWTPQQRALIDLLLDELIPASADGRKPAAGKLGIADFIARHAAGNAELATILCDGTTELVERLAVQNQSFAETEREGRVAFVKQIENAMPAYFEALLRLTYMGYYSRGDIRESLGLSAKPVHPHGYAVPRETPELMDELTRPVRARGRCYREA